MSLKINALSVALLTTLAATSLSATAAPSDDVILTGIITNTTCDVTANNGQPSLNVGVYKSGDFAAGTQLGAVPLDVLLENCDADENGTLIIQGVASSDSTKLFVSDEADSVGFMIQDSAKAQIEVDNGVALAVTKAAGGNYQFIVGMGSTTVAPAAGSYEAPITIAYIVN
ncbi:fimbrial protein [Serratia microhaemolytica]|uniref:fimbrial protein n=1 Tax=Serratia microhaemolytica TaxID=2675110 RepID=UPI000FDDC171|nr:type 1 fimbrial protein [Serratia microhaemolytica]